MEFRVLGPMEVWEDDHALDLGARMPRALLALLLMDARVPDRAVRVHFRRPVDLKRPALRGRRRRQRQTQARLHFDEAASDAEAAADGWYALLTNLDPGDADAAEVLVRYKGQEVVERRYGDFKGPLAVAPMMLKSNRRIQALISLICLALLVFCLVETCRAPRHVAAATMVGLNPERRAVKPTGRLVFAALSGIRLIPATRTSHALIPRPSPVQRHLMDLPGVDPLALGSRAEPDSMTRHLRPAMCGTPV